MPYKLEKKWEKYFVIISLIITILGFIYFNVRNKNRIENIELNGIDSVGIITYLSPGSHGRISSNWAVSFYFIINKDTIIVHNCNVSEDYYNKYAIFGMKYKIKYLPYSPKEAIIFLDKPISFGYSEIYEEREKIFKMFPNYDYSFKWAHNHIILDNEKYNY
jgi:hypothetical protein